MNLDHDKLKTMNQFIFDPAQNTFRRSDTTLKDFYASWLDAIKNAIRNFDENEEKFDYFGKFRKFVENEHEYTFSPGTEIQVKKKPGNLFEYVHNDVKIIQEVGEALIEVFGYEAFTLLTHGIMTIYIDSNGDCQLKFKNQVFGEIADMGDEFGIKTLVSPRALKSIMDLYLGSYSGQMSFWTSNLLLGHRNVVNIKYQEASGSPFSEERREIIFYPKHSIMFNLFENVLNPEAINVLSRDSIFSYNKELLEMFYNDYLTEKIPSLPSKSSSYRGNEKFVLEGFQEIADVLYQQFEKSSAAAAERIVRHFSSQGLDIRYSKQVLTDYLLIDLIDGLFKSTYKNYHEQISQALQNGKGSLWLKGTPAANTNPEFSGAGLEIRLTFENIDPMKKAKMAWALMVGNYDILASDKELKSLHHVKDTIIEEMKTPVHHIYDKLYNALRAYVHGGDDGNGFYTGRLEETQKFYASFYKPSESGMSKTTALSKKGIKPIELNLENEEEFQKDLACVIYNMVKHMATVVIKQGSQRSPILVLAANQFRVLDEEYIQQNFYSTKISVSLFNEDRHDKRLTQWKDSKTYKDLKKEYKFDPETGGHAFQISNAYPIYVFKDAELFAELFAEIMSQCGTLSESLRPFSPEYLS
ncbi:MAG: hypothetical protein BAJALOKI2v1_70091 [Promethearchaeota archaeon]|nr:MAG: hypothetical protein BAJALOKI2v1_70091 [Candidatus Lokiarchaeota archaeon]